MNYIDLFAGAGGLSEGFHNAGFHPVAHVEMNRDACYSIRTRLAWYQLRQENRREKYNDYLLQRITRKELYALMPKGLMASVINKSIAEETRDEIFKLIDAQRELLPENDRQIDLIIGGPPCQTFSVAGRARLGREAMEKDPRSRLYLQYAEFLKKYQPRMFIFENVLGMLSFRQSKQLALIRQTFLDAGYYMDVREWNARDFGVLQSRERLIIVGWRIDQIGLGYPAFRTLTAQQREQYTVGEVLAHLPPLTIQESIKGAKPKKSGPPPVSMYPNRLARGLESDYIINYRLREECPVLTWHVARPQTAFDREIYRLYIRHWNTNQNERPRLRYNELPESYQVHDNKDDFSDRFKVVAADKTYSQTVVAHIHKDGHYYIHPDETQARSLSVREAARLQSFPDNFYFEGSRTSALRQIGNAVPPLMGTRVAESVWNALNGQGEFLATNSPVGKHRSGRVDRLQIELFEPEPVCVQA